MILDFLIPRRPLSVNANHKKLQRWKQYVHAVAAETWVDAPIPDSSIHLKLVYLYDKDPVDTDNIIKPIQDALNGLIYDDDVNVTDVEAHRRHLSDVFDITDFPTPLLNGLYSGNECVYVQINQAESLEDYL